MNRTAIRLSWSLFMRRWWMQVIVVMLLAVALVMGNSLVGILYDGLAANRLFRGFDDRESTALFIPQDVNASNGVWKQLEHTTYESVTLREGGDQHGQAFTMALYGARTCEGMKLPTQVYEDGSVACAASPPYRVGEVIQTEYRGEPLTLRVTKRLPYHAPYLAFSTVSNEPTYEMVCERATMERPVVMVCRADLPQDLGPRSRECAVVFLNEPCTADETQLTNIGFLLPLTQVDTESREEITHVLAAYMPLVLCTFLIGVVSLMGLMMMLILRQMRALVIFRLCGLSRRGLGAIGRAYGWMLSLGAAAVAAVGMVTVSPVSVGENSISVYNVVFTLALLGLPVLLAAWLPRRMIPREAPLAALSETEAMI